MKETDHLQMMNWMPFFLKKDIRLGGKITLFYSLKLQEIFCCGFAEYIDSCIKCFNTCSQAEADYSKMVVTWFVLFLKLLYVYTLRLIGPISYSGECDLMVLPRKHIVIFSRMHFVTFLHI